MDRKQSHAMLTALKWGKGALTLHENEMPHNKILTYSSLSNQWVHPNYKEKGRRRKTFKKMATNRRSWELGKAARRGNCRALRTGKCKNPKLH